MPSIMDVKSKHRPPVKLIAGLAIASLLLVGTYVASAGAEERHGDQRGGQHHDNRGHDGDRGGGYYGAPPVVYANPGYYAAPPVVYSPGVAVVMPGISIGIQ
jgi:hypothetical protein